MAHKVHPNSTPTNAERDAAAGGDRVLVRKPGSKVFNVREAALFLRCHEDTVREYIRAGNLPAARIGKGFKIKLEDLQRFWDSRSTNL